MDFRFSHTLAAAFVSCAAALAIAQAPAAPGAGTPSTAVTKPVFAQEPVASAATGASGPHAATANTIVEALNADRSLQGSKFSVTPGENGVLLGGVTPSLRQMAQAINLAGQHAGGATVTSIISSEEVVVDAGAVAPDPQSMVSADEASAASERNRLQGVPSPQ